MNIPVDWPDTVTVSTRNLLATILFLADNGFVPSGPCEQSVADEACRAFDPLCDVLDAKCPGWL